MNSRLLTLLSCLLPLLTWANSKMTIYASGNGKVAVYQQKSQSNPSWCSDSDSSTITWDRSDAPWYLYAKPDDGYELVGWINENGVRINEDPPLTNRNGSGRYRERFVSLSMSTANYTYTAIFEKTPNEQPYEADANGVTIWENVAWNQAMAFGEMDSSYKVDGYTTKAPTWETVEGAAVSVTAPLSGSELYFHGKGRVDIYSVNTLDTVLIGGDNGGDNGRVQVYLHPDATLVKSGGLVRMSCSADDGDPWGLHLMGGTHDCNIEAGSANDNRPGAFFVEAGTTNVLLGSFTTLWGNKSTMGIKGYLEIRGGVTALSPKNNEGAWRPFAREDKSYAEGYLKISGKPIVADRVCLPRGTLELAAADNTFAVRGLFIEGGAVKTTVAGALKTGVGNKLKLTSGTLDLGGFTQGVDFFYGNGGTVTSATAAQLRVQDNALFYDSCWSSGAEASWPRLEMGLNATVCTTRFTGAAGLSKEGSGTLTIGSANHSSGTLSVSGGTLALNSDGAWRNGTVEVAGGALEIRNSQAFSNLTKLRISGGSYMVSIDDGVHATVGELFIEGVRQPSGTTYGAPGSGAKHESPVFMGSGILEVKPPPGVCLFFGAPVKTPPPPPSIRFGVVSDLHLTTHGTPSETYDYGYDRTFVKTLQYFHDQNVDAVVIAGDLADRGLPENLAVAMSAWNEVFADNTNAKGDPVERIFIYGNHDADQGWFDSTTAGQSASERARSISRNEQSTWEQYVAEPWQTAYMKTVKGYHFVAAQWGHETDAIAILKREHEKLAGRQPFFYIQHAHLPCGIYGEENVDAKASDVAAALTAFPNAVTFTGDSHYTASLEASIHQDAFTSVGTGSLSYIGKFSGGLNLSAVRRDNREAFLVDVVGNQVTIKRQEFEKNEDLGPDWTFSTPLFAANSPYTYANEAARLARPEFPANAALTATTDGGLTLTIPKCVYDDAHARAIWFDVIVRRNGTPVTAFALQQDGYFYPYDQVPESTTTTHSFASHVGDVVEVLARDFYGRQSKPLTKVIQ